MTKDNVTDWSTTAADNTDVGGIDISEGCPAANMNNMGREIMAQIADTNVPVLEGFTPGTNKIPYTSSEAVGGTLEFIGEGEEADDDSLAVVSKGYTDANSAPKGDFAQFIPPFGLTPNMDLGGLEISYNYTFDASDTGTKPAYGVSVEINGDEVHADGERMFGGIGLYAQARLDGGTGTENSFFSAIAGYAVQNLNGDGDGIGVHGRGRKTNQVGNVGDAAGVLGDCYQISTEAGGVMGVEARIYRNVAGRAAGDEYTSGSWDVGIHVLSDSTGSPATAGIVIGGEGFDAGKYSFWRGLQISRNSFGHNGSGAGISGTVGVDMSDWTSNFYAEKAIEFGYGMGPGGGWHLYRGGSEGIHAAANLFQVSNPDASGTSGMRIRSEGSFNAYFDLLNGSDFKANFFWDNTDDTVKIGTAHDGDFVLRRNSDEKMRVKANTINFDNIPTSASGLSSGDIWRDGTTLKIVV